MANRRYARQPEAPVAEYAMLNGKEAFQSMKTWALQYDFDKWLMVGLGLLIAGVVWDRLRKPRI